MKGIALGVDVIDFVLVFAVDNEKNVWQRVGRVRIVGDGERVKLLLRADCRKRTRRFGLGWE